MSILRCDKCGDPFDTDDDPDCLVEVGNMRRMHKEESWCERCRNQAIEEAETEAYERSEP
jgi:hypothetical protein